MISSWVLLGVSERRLYNYCKGFKTIGPLFEKCEEEKPKKDKKKSKKPPSEAIDPIQKLFLEKAREYKDLKITDLSPEIVKEREKEMHRINTKYDVKDGTDMTKYPDLKFEDVKIDPIDTIPNLDKK